MLAGMFLSVISDLIGWWHRKCLGLLSNEEKIASIWQILTYFELNQKQSLFFLRQSFFFFLYYALECIWMPHTQVFFFLRRGVLLLYLVIRLRFSPARGEKTLGKYIYRWTWVISRDLDESEEPPVQSFKFKSTFPETFGKDFTMLESYSVTCHVSVMSGSVLARSVGCGFISHPKPELVWKSWDKPITSLL